MKAIGLQHTPSTVWNIQGGKMWQNSMWTRRPSYPEMKCRKIFIFWIYCPPRGQIDHAVGKILARTMDCYPFSLHFMVTLYGWAFSEPKEFLFVSRKSLRNNPFSRCFVPEIICENVCLESLGNGWDLKDSKYDWKKRQFTNKTFEISANATTSPCLFQDCTDTETPFCGNIPFVLLLGNSRVFCSRLALSKRVHEDKVKRWKLNDTGYG